MPTKYKVNLHNIIKFQVAGDKNLDNYDIAGTEQTEKKERKSDKNLLQNQDEKNGYNGEISKRTKAKIQTLMQNWLLAGKVADKNGYKQKKGKMSKSKRKWIRLKKGRIIRRMLRLRNKNRMG